MSILSNIVHHPLHVLDHLAYSRREIDESASNSPAEQRLPALVGLEDWLIRRQCRHAIVDDSSPLASLDCLDGTLDEQRFVELSDGLRAPVVLRGLIRNYPCVEHWSLDYLEQLCHDVQIPVLLDASKQLALGTTPVDTMTFGDVAKAIQKGEPTYVNNISSLFAARPILQDQLQQSRVAEALGGVVGFNPAQMFIGAKGTRTDYHCAMLHNMFYNVKGRKTWSFIHPRYTQLMKGTVARSGMYAVSQHSNFDSPPELLEHIPVFKTTLEEGDVLFNPSFWWHAVINESAYSIGVANRLVNRHDWLGINNMVWPNPLYAFEMFFFGQHIKSAMFQFNHQALDQSITDDFSK